MCRARCRLARELPERLEGRRHDKAGRLGALGEQTIQGVLGGIYLRCGITMHGVKVRRTNEFHQRDVHYFLPISAGLELTGGRRENNRTTPIWTCPAKRQHGSTCGETCDNGQPPDNLCQYRFRNLPNQLHVEATW